MFDEPARDVMRPREVLKAAPDTLVSEVGKLMAAQRVGAILVVQGDQAVGIFTGRDVFRVVTQGLDVRTTRLGDVMTCATYTIDTDEPFWICIVGNARKNSFRHLPVVEQGKSIGIVSSRGAMDLELEEFGCDEFRRKSFNKERALSRLFEFCAWLIFARAQTIGCARSMRYVTVTL